MCRMNHVIVRTLIDFKQILFTESLCFIFWSIKPARFIGKEILGVQVELI